MRVAQLVAKNVIALGNGKTGLKPYKPHSTMMMLPLGSADGVAQTPMGVMGGKMVKGIKSKDLFVPKAWATLNAAMPAKLPVAAPATA